MNFNCRLMIALLMMAALSSVMTPAFAGEPYIGRIESVDPSILRITIRTESGQVESFSVSDSNMLRQLKPDDYVQVETGTDGMANRIMKVSPSEKGGRSTTGNTGG